MSFYRDMIAHLSGLDQIHETPLSDTTLKQIDTMSSDELHEAAGRALRRHHAERMKKNRSRIWGKDLRNEPRLLGIAARTPKPCSCLICGNARHHAGATMQERRAADSALSSENEVMSLLDG